MRRILFGLSVLLCAGVALAQAPEPGLTERFDSEISPQEMDGWMKLMAAEPNHVGSPHDKANAAWLLKQFRAYGWDAHIETFKVLYPTPLSETLEMAGPKPWKAMLQEPPIPGDTSARAKQYALPAYVAYQGDGDVTARLVYVNYGNLDDYKRLAQFGIDVRGKIVIARYGQGWRGLKPKLAQEHGAIGCLIYSDPSDDGYSVDSVYPKGPARPPHGIQRGSVADMTLYPGDPLTPGVGATDDAKRLTREEAPSLMHIPTLPISYADAQALLETMSGPVAPEGWRGRLPITYRVGPGTRPVHLAVKSEWGLKPIYDVIATLKGSTWPDQWVIRGNHYDGWVFGASDPLAGQVAMLEEAKALGALARGGWKPKRTIVYTSWDAEEPMLLGSTEWAETHADELKQKAMLYINSDGNGRGILNAGGSEDMEKFVGAVAAGVIDPETHVPVGQRRRAAMGVYGMGPGDEHQKWMEKTASDPTKDAPIAPLGSGSDYSPFLQHLGIETLDFGFGGEGNAGGVYHSRYDTYEHHTRFVDPGFVYAKVLAEMAGHAVIAAADADLPVQQTEDFADGMAQYADEIKKLADTRRETAEKQNALLQANAFALAADPTKPHADPVALKPVPKFDFSPLDDAIAALKKSAKAYDEALAANGAKLPPDRLARLQSLMQSLDQTLLNERGLPGRDWYRNLVYAPGRFTGYGAKTLPGIREAIEEERWDDAVTYISLTADAFHAYAKRLDEATAVLQ
ncbi:MAG TPA: transferrin receptor-like dimerization domain-containing protein [Rhizomicrobium sp.]|nr:transferrin receptor-like dimerization domain-containing protein [Rhizomicrobium sp.]